MGYEGPGIPVFERDQPSVSYMASAAPSLLNVIVWVRTRGGGIEILSRDFDTFITDRSTNLLYLPRASNDGVVAALTVRATGVPLRGAFFMIISIQPNTPTQRILSSDYLYRFHLPILGSNVGPGPEGGPGLMRSIDLGNPAANVEYTAQTVPTNTMWRLKGFRGDLVADANAADRNFRIIIQDGANVEVSGGRASNVHQANVTVDYIGLPGGAVLNSEPITNAGYAEPISLPEIDIPQGYDIVFETTNRQVGDDWESGQILVEEWLVA